jgi:hypothetical protein
MGEGGREKEKEYLMFYFCAHIPKMIYLENAARSSPLTVSMLLLLYSVFLFHHSNTQNIQEYFTTAILRN